ncbi:hypothetical protein [Xylella fastidiosa]|uniref:hypothetical protein n=1 Tax=Xylella fastidiosa TaxID=2371 RepID=UPI000165D923|nr:hypothetical protein [Xylella fastidiosa]ACA13139.1 conserved hypothetical protein [Xylella fastidiosa M12]KFA40908.1 hypothetical protein DF22_002581 [Xylella fastidiosa]MCH7235092.1 hypothetical protein [Xylella fastidiosa subsp. multiplex]MCO5545327.1 hypothetical protein [Xylella fastidiosa]MDC6410934.1 hypothetical protein [Xylella fastidiosa subsp. multiplex]
MTFNDIMNRVLPPQDKSSSHRLVFLLTMIFFVFLQNVHANNVHTPTIKASKMIPDEDREYAESMFKEHPEIFPKERRSSILHGIILLGMTPFEAKLAGGAFFYKVTADTSRWPEHSDPMKVMWAQSIKPDNSEIWMTFKNAYQFPGEGDIPFRVHFKKGHAVNIEKLDK